MAEGSGVRERRGPACGSGGVRHAGADRTLCMVRGENGPGVLYGADDVIPVEIAASWRARTRGLLGRDGIEGALLLTPASSVHTFRMRFAIDVAYLSRDFTVLAVRTMRPGRLGLPRLRARHVLEAEAGAMARWGLRPGLRLGVEPVR
ncbi:hypothetical protein SAMN05428954_2573 [Streptomyces sp. 2112.3]|nr:hypothetical protein BX261_4788 [Streptomyces sp. 2321.6]SDR26560.1 hypothetical protein SAMN05216511_2475 [Streptomyces sp. KS_16]SED44696.1 hypothetical protein SAMN05428940_4814 [Streptomyces sp. 2133.1]SEE42040.1 hypothetical protein SAMN05428954_2573 [Streptomyces sp. 2112.3]SNC70815.1 hypothetical protein SAMN06272741_4714 [Streptomyces sp. 2114.4]